LTKGWKTWYGNVQKINKAQVLLMSSSTNARALEFANEQNRMKSYFLNKILLQQIKNEVSCRESRLDSCLS
jgi:hypothetical protein